MIAKRIIDLFGSILGLLVFSPLIILAIFGVKMQSPGPATFAQPRIGREGRQFVCYKLRTMYENTENRPTHEIGSAAVTPIGSFLRRSKLDELPQLFNVLRGDMSLVGPRPCLPIQSELIEARQRSSALNVLPGITGLAQVQGVDMSDPQRLAEIDGQYAKTRTFFGDLALILRTMTGSGLNLDPSTVKQVNEEHQASSSK